MQDFLKLDQISQFYTPEKTNLNEFVQFEEVQEKKVLADVSKKILTAKTPEDIHPISLTHAPLTEEEAYAVDEYIESLKNELAGTLNKLNALKQSIDSAAAPQGGAEFNLKINMSKKPTLRRAVQKVFGIKTDVLTYSMYKEALKAKARLEEEESDAYVGNTDE